MIKKSTLVLQYQNITMRLLFSLLIILFFGQFPTAQTSTITNLNSPYDCMYNHLYYLQPEHYDAYQSSLSFTEDIDSIKTINYAIKTKQILDAKGLYVYMNTIPTNNQYTDSLSGNAVFTPFKTRLPQLYLESINGQWKYAQSYTLQLDKLYKQTFPYGTHKLVQYFNNQNQTKVLGLSLWQYIAILCLLLISFLLYKAFGLTILYFINKIIPSSFIPKGISLQKLSTPLGLTFVLFLLKTFIPILQLQVKWAEYLHIGLRIITSVVIGILLIRILSIAMNYMSNLALKTENKLDEQLLPIIHRLGQIIIFIITTLYILQMLNINIAALIAGVSIGGLALALAAQDTVKNLIGSLMIFIDTPFQIGDYIIVNGMEGSVVEVGFRSTKISTMDSSIITLPNGSLSSASLTNKGARQYRIFNTILTLSYKTKASNIKKFTQGLKEIILHHEHTDKEGYYVHLTNLNSSSIDIMFRTKLYINTYDEELILKENMLYDIIQLAEDLNIDFAFPSQSLYIEKS